PLVLIPAYMVPLFIMMHFTALAQAGRRAKGEGLGVKGIPRQQRTFEPTNLSPTAGVNATPLLQSRSRQISPSSSGILGRRGLGRAAHCRHIPVYTTLGTAH